MDKKSCRRMILILIIIIIALGMLAPFVMRLWK